MPTPLVVIINADMAFLEMMASFLRDEGYEALIVNENNDAYTIIKQRKPTVVMIELLLYNPEAGLMILNKLRLDPDTAHIPVIIASTATDLIQRNEAHLRTMGCDILPKPFYLETFLEIVSKYAPLTGA